MIYLYIIGALLVFGVIQTSRASYWKGRFESLANEAGDNQSNLKRVVNRLLPKQK